MCPSTYDYLYQIPQYSKDVFPNTFIVFFTTFPFIYLNNCILCKTQLSFLHSIPFLLYCDVNTHNAQSQWWKIIACKPLGGGIKKLLGTLLEVHVKCGQVYPMDNIMCASTQIYMNYLIYIIMHQSQQGTTFQNQGKIKLTGEKGSLRKCSIRS